MIIMPLVQVRIDDQTKIKANIVFEELGLDMSTAIRMFLKKVIEVRGIPFPPLLTEEEKIDRFDKALAAINKMAEEKGLSNMTLDEINEEIALARKERRERNKKN